MGPTSPALEFNIDGRRGVERDEILAGVEAQPHFAPLASVPDDASRPRWPKRQSGAVYAAPARATGGENGREKLRAAIVCEGRL